MKLLVQIAGYKFCGKVVNERKKTAYSLKSSPGGMLSAVEEFTA